MLDLSRVWPELKAVEKIGEGSFGKVYKCEREEFGIKSVCAVKVISIPQSQSEIESMSFEGVSDEGARTYYSDVVKDFANEIKLMEMLKGAPNIVNVENFRIIERENEIGWDIFIRMEYLKSFVSYSRNKHLTEEDVKKFALDIANALVVCSEYGIIHRDIKPDNIFIDKFGSYKLGDFGVARRLEGTMSVMSKKGTYSYMAPEVFRGEKYDNRADIYSLGMVMYKLLNRNRDPFVDVNSAAIGFKERNEAIERRRSGERLPAPVDASPSMAAVILKACEFRPEDRYASVEEFRAAIFDVNDVIAAPAAEEPTVAARDCFDNTVAARNFELPTAATAQADYDDATVVVNNQMFEEATELISDEATVMAERDPEATMIADVTFDETIVSAEKKDLPKGNKKRNLIIGLASSAVLVILIVIIVTVLLKGRTSLIAQTPKTEEFYFNGEKIAVGEYITFGSYEQDNDLSNGKEPIEWLVLDKQDGRILVISKYALDAKPYNDELAHITWETCTLRSWLNDKFFSEAFTSSEKSKVPTVTVTADSNPNFDTNPGNYTQDKAFLLSIDEANEYFDSDGERECRATEYAVAQGAWVSEGTGYEGNCRWRLRTPGDSSILACYVFIDGFVNYHGYSVIYSDIGVRPALWINL